MLLLKKSHHYLHLREVVAVVDVETKVAVVNVVKVKVVDAAAEVADADANLSKYNKKKVS